AICRKNENGAARLYRLYRNTGGHTYQNRESWQQLLLNGPEYPVHEQVTKEYKETRKGKKKTCIYGN
ncbi:hypothetical protein, partial [Thiolapillus sp.]|uniref:hypothetical protein n=1 Tax=Thiolapillus sp. TaxID=2017437 RepID=UPI003AF84524